MNQEQRRAAAIAALNALEADDFAPVLNTAAVRAYEAAGELQAAWQDKGPARVWNRIGNTLTTAARRPIPPPGAPRRRHRDMLTEANVMASMNLSDDDWDALPDAVRAKLAAQIEALIEAQRCAKALQETDEMPPDTCPADLYDIVTNALNQEG